MEARKGNLHTWYHSFGSLEGQNFQFESLCHALAVYMTHRFRGSLHAAEVHGAKEQSQLRNLLDTKRTIMATGEGQTLLLFSISEYTNEISNNPGIQLYSMMESCCPRAAVAMEGKEGVEYRCQPSLCEGAEPRQEVIVAIR